MPLLEARDAVLSPRHDGWPRRGSSIPANDPETQWWRFGPPDQVVTRALSPSGRGARCQTPPTPRGPTKMSWPFPILLSSWDPDELHP